MKKKIDTRLKKLVLNQHKNNPGLGVRKLASLLDEKHGVSVSKSTVHLILQSANAGLKKGAKKAKLVYEKTDMAESGLIILRCIDSQVGFFDYLSEELSIYFPKLTKELLKKFIVLLSFAFLSTHDLGEITRKKSFLRLASLYRFPVKKFSYFKKQIVRYQPSVELKPLYKNLIIIAGIKIIFSDGSYIFSDPKLATLWDNLPQIDYFFTSLKSCKDKIDRMLKQKRLVFGYTKSFGYLSALVFKLMDGQKKGIIRIEFFDRTLKLVDEIEINKKIEVVLGYYPKGVSKGIEFNKDKKHYKRVHLECLGSFYLMNINSKFFQLTGKEGVIFGIVLINKKSYGVPDWGIISSSGENKGIEMKNIFKNYTYLWPDMEKNLSQGIEEIEKSFLIEKSQKNEIAGIIPRKLTFFQLNSFGRVGQLLSVIFKEIVEGIEPKQKRGFFAKGKDYILVVLKELSLKTKKRLDRQAFFLDQKRVFFR